MPNTAVEITSQSHGDTFANAVKGDDWWRGAADHGRDNNSPFDIEGRFDKRARIPTQVKVSGNNTFPLADATRYWTIDEPLRKVLAQWLQDGETKLIWAVTEIILHGCMMKTLRGRTSHAEVSDCHAAIRAHRKIVDEVERLIDRAKIDKRIAAMQTRTPLLTFNPKIDETNHRLQVSATLTVLGRMARMEEPYRCRNGHLHRNREVYLKKYGKRISIPYPIESGVRTFKNGAGGGIAPLYKPVPSLFDDLHFREPSPLNIALETEKQSKTDQVAVAMDDTTGLFAFMR